MTDCAICEHTQRDHYGSGCHARGSLRGSCSCTYVNQPPLPARASAEDHQERSSWWDEQARIAWDLALAARYDLDRWYPLMRLYRVARRAEIDHRLMAESLVGPLPVSGPPPAPALEPVPVEQVQPGPVRVESDQLEPAPEFLVFPVAEPRPLMSLGRRLHLTEAA